MNRFASDWWLGMIFDNCMLMITLRSKVDKMYDIMLSITCFRRRVGAGMIVKSRHETFERSLLIIYFSLAS